MTTLKQFIEANMLDGQPLNDCGGAMVAATEVYEVMRDYIVAARLDAARKMFRWCQDMFAMPQSEPDDASLAKIVDPYA